MSINGHFRNLNWRYLPGTYHINGHFRILKFPLSFATSRSAPLRGGRCLQDRRYGAAARATGTGLWSFAKSSGIAFLDGDGPWIPDFTGKSQWFPVEFQKKTNITLRLKMGAFLMEKFNDHDSGVDCSASCRTLNLELCKDLCYLSYL